MIKGKFAILAIESSCDETAAAVVLEGREVLSNVISSQIEIHKAYGGVVPEIASRHHLNNVNWVCQQALDQASETLAAMDAGETSVISDAALKEGGSGGGLSMDDIDAIAVTYGPGLVGALLIGLATAKAYALAMGKPLIGVHHIHGHICANFIEHKDLKPPFMALVISGGHTNIVEVSDYNEYQVLGGTRDDAAGEAYDKVARVLGLGYPGGPLIDKIAKSGNPEAVEFKRVFLEKDSFDFSFSGIKTGVLNYVNSEKQAGREINVPDVAAGFQQAVLDVIVTKTVTAAIQMNKDKIVMAGGVAANSRLREMLQAECDKHGISLYHPSPILCTDNAAMIGCAAYYNYKAGKISDLTLDAIPNLPL
ncbi:MAG: tRNA (adenosine(37)-N6)-threonylcarbamoyltransferase complex transferase subunit TsaD [Eubacteriales bacterium]|nr:tRNA (adenosine(37)-N6)-threonylcarbamoyltransferase complex transferase subunit TsaD [Eubacteriales bacterium]